MERSVKRLATSFQEKRRAAALDKQKSARRQTTDRARKLALGAASDLEQQGPEKQQDVQQPASQQQVRPSCTMQPPSLPLPAFAACCLACSPTLTGRPACWPPAHPTVCY